MGDQSYFATKDAEALDEYKNSLIYNSTSNNTEVSPISFLTKNDSFDNFSPAYSPPTLYDIKRKNQQEIDSLKDEAHLKRFKIHNYTSEDSQIVKNEKSLKTYYCSVCGAHCIITDANFNNIPRRETDGALALQEDLWFHKKYVLPDKKVNIRRIRGVNIQFRFRCKDCNNVLGYRSYPLEKKSKFTYFFPDSLVSEQSSAAAFKGGRSV